MSGELPVWLTTIGLGRYATRFAEQAVEFRDLARLTEADIEKLVVPPAHRKRLMRAIAALTMADLAEKSAPLRRTRRIAERRHLTVMFGDIVGSTALSHRLDPEELSAVMHRYRRICVRVSGRFGGHVARYTGDGVLIYFGWPQAFEDHAERSIRAGLELIEAVSADRAGDGPPLSIRVGISSGLVAIGATDDEHGAEDVIGETTNVASRIQDLAASNSVVVAPSTYRLARGVFEYRDLGERRLKGLPKPLRIRQVVRARTFDTRFEAYRAPKLAPLVGRTPRDVAAGEPLGSGQVRRWPDHAGVGRGGDRQVAADAGVLRSRPRRCRRRAAFPVPAASRRHGALSDDPTLVDCRGAFGRGQRRGSGRQGEAGAAPYRHGCRAGSGADLQHAADSGRQYHPGPRTGAAAIPPEIDRTAPGGAAANVGARDPAGRRRGRAVDRSDDRRADASRLCRAEATPDLHPRHVPRRISARTGVDIGTRHRSSSSG